MLADSCTDIGQLWDLDQRRNGAGTHSEKPDGNWDKIAEQMMIDFAESGHLVCRAAVLL